VNSNGTRTLHFHKPRTPWPPVILGINIFELISLVAWIVLFGTGILKCRTIAERPEANRKCVLSLLILLLMALVSGAMTTIAGWLPAELASVVRIAVTIVSTVLLILVIAVSTKGRYEFNADGAKYEQGEDQAIYAAVLALLILGTGVTDYFIRMA